VGVYHVAHGTARWGSRRVRRSLTALGLLALVTGCRPVISTPVIAPTTAPTAPGPGGGSPTRLVIWTVPPFAATRSDGSPTDLGTLLEAYTDAHPDLEVAVKVRPERGPAAIDVFVAAARRAVPDTLPDLVTLPLAAISATVAADLVAPLPSGRAAGGTDSLFPCAAQVIPARTPTLGVLPFALNILHTVARDGQGPPKWSAVGQPGRYLVPGDGPPALGLLGAWYASVGGMVDTLPAVDRPAVLALTRFVADRVARGDLAVGASDGGDRGTWNALLADPSIAAAAVPAGVFVTQQPAFPALGWSQLPGRDGPASGLAWGWAWVLTARDPQRRARAADLAEWLTARPQRMWVTHTGYLPASSDDFAADLRAAIDPPPAPAYLSFLANALARARPVAASGPWTDDWSAALGDLLTAGSAEAAATRMAPP
jgi:hypothetical protein